MSRIDSLQKPSVLDRYRSISIFFTIHLLLDSVDVTSGHTRHASELILIARAML